MLRIVGILAIVAVLASAVFASAAALNVDGGFIQVGEDGSLTCASQAVVTSWGLETDDDSVRSIKIAGLSGCQGGVMFLEVQDEGGTRIQRSPELDIPADSVWSVPLSPYVSAEDIGGIKIWVHNKQ